MRKYKGHENSGWTEEAFADKRHRTLRLGSFQTLWQEEVEGEARFPLEKYILVLPL